MQGWASQARNSRGGTHFCSSSEHFACPFQQTRVWTPRQHCTAWHSFPSSTPKCMSVSRGETRPNQTSEAGRTGRRFSRCHRVANACARAGIIKSPLAAVVVWSEVYRSGQGVNVGSRQSSSLFTFISIAFWCGRTVCMEWSS